MKRLVVVSLIIAGLLAILYATQPLARLIGVVASTQNIPASMQGPTPEPATPSAADRTAIEQAVRQAATANPEANPVFLIFEVRISNVRLSADRLWAAVWLATADPLSGEILAGEPALAFAHWNGSAWQITLPSDPGWAATLEKLPAEVLSAEGKAYWRQQYLQSPAFVYVGPFDGYKLPWTYGETMRLSRSTAHDEDYSDHFAHFAYDFSNGNYFDIRAAKSGTVWRYYDEYPDNYHNWNNCNEANYLVLRDDSTTPVTYQLYLHLAQGSIPDELKQRDVAVAQGQPIGIADNVGCSTGHHLHFHVHTLSSGWWGMAVDIQFGEVLQNHGRPRNAADVPFCTLPQDECSETNLYYTSGNVYLGDTHPPSGDLLNIEDGDVISTGSLLLEGWGTDDKTGLAKAQFVAFYEGEWHPIGPVFTTSPFSFTWDMCASDVPDGVISVAARLTDVAGNTNFLAGLRHVTKSHRCTLPPPECTPGADQVALFSYPNYLGCNLYSVGDYPDLGELVNNNAQSILLGANVYATLYASDAAPYHGRGETFWRSDPDLYDNLVGPEAVSSLQVRSLSSLPLAPAPLSPAPGSTLDAANVLTLVWENGGGATEYQVILTSSVTTTWSDWQRQPTLHLEALAPMTYTWSVQARNASGLSPRSITQTFTVTANTPLPQPTFTAPKTFDMESGASDWLASGLWQRISGGAHGGSYSWWYQNGSSNYDTGQANAGDLTSPYVNIPAAGHYYLRFYYRHETETQTVYWDQRWLQISVNGGAFRDTWQFSDDPQIGDTSSWLLSPPIDLAAYAGQTIRMRFHFDTLDAALNNYRGWGIDDLSINTSAPSTCSDVHEPNNTLAQAAAIAYGQTLEAQICPNGDLDYYAFTGAAGDTIAVNIDAQVLGSLLDSYLSLIDTDGFTVLAEHDDEIYAELKDSLLVYTLPANGTYTLKVRSWNHPSGGGSTYNYTLGLYTDITPPSVTLTYPVSHTFIGGSVNITANPGDAGSGISRVDFYGHDSDWRNTDWQLLGRDWSSAGGWGITFDTSGEPDQNDMALYAYAYDKAGNLMGNGAWHLSLDNTPPTSALAPIAARQPVNVFRVDWTGSDAGSGISAYDLQWTSNQGANWSTISGIPAVDSYYWLVAEPGQEIGLRLRATDAVGNVEAYPGTSEITTTTTTAAELCAALDPWETDNTAISATLTSTGTASIHNTCNPLAANFQNDEDWLKFNPLPGHTYIIAAVPLDDATAMIVSLYSGDGVNMTLLAEATPAEFGLSTPILWKAETTAPLYVRLRPLDGRLIGGTYQAVIADAKSMYLPIISK